MIETISKTGGHLASNLGAVELTMALHLALDLPKDKIIWDVGHQAYTHKILTGRKDKFDTLRQYGGLSGFPKRCESSSDCFDTGHSSTSISAGLGMVKARDLMGEDYTVVSVIGDGSLTGGLAYEALNNASKLDTNFIIILNDNEMSISESVGGMKKYLNSVRTAEGYLNLKEDIYAQLSNNHKVVDGIRRAKNSFKQLFVPGMVFENLGITYLGPVDGHNVASLEKAIKEAKKVKKAVMIHVMTKKGKGYGPAERHPARFHGEISNCRYHPSGHIYFTMKDSGGAISCVMFRGDRDRGGLKFQMKEGQQVKVSGTVDVYERDGKYQLYARRIELDGEGALFEKFEELKKRLAESGMFADEYKQPIPTYIKTLGVVTASTGAAVRDIINVATRRNPHIQIILYPAIVQGDQAAESIVRGIETLSEMQTDVIIVGRGGGSIEDLWAFNEEIVAEAIFNCPVPIISAVGHETDTTIADYVADRRAPTPSATVK